MSFFDRLKAGLGKTRSVLTQPLKSLAGVFRNIDEEYLEELEMVLLAADLGVKTTMELLDEVRRAWKKGDIDTTEKVPNFLKKYLAQILNESQGNLVEDSSKPWVTLVVGVNGVGKTTTIAKLAHYYKEKGEKVLLGAGDTFRAAAATQLETWGERVGVDVIRQADGADPAAVAFDTVKAALARKSDRVIIDTAGRLHNKTNLMEEMKKIERVIRREIPAAPQEILLVIDGNTGQNGISQAKEFASAVPLTGLVVTKLDGTAKGGIVLAINRELGLPVRWIGVGEGMTDLQPFDSDQFLDAIFSDN
ncbi:MAG: signal recognition particle-docking protein FtsY [Negativicutes bacterium]|nr:signal recognition particle-docking protein FtsY [Negativicutes bacterium]